MRLRLPFRSRQVTQHHLHHRIFLWINNQTQLNASTLMVKFNRRACLPGLFLLPSPISLFTSFFLSLSLSLHVRLTFVLDDDDDGLEILATAQSTSMGVTHASNIILKWGENERAESRYDVTLSFLPKKKIDAGSNAQPFKLTRKEERRTEWQRLLLFLQTFGFSFV